MIESRSSCTHDTIHATRICPILQDTPVNYPQSHHSHTHDECRKYKKHVASTPSCLQNKTNEVLHLLPPPHYLHPPIPLSNVHLHLLFSLSYLLHFPIPVPAFLTTMQAFSCEPLMHFLTPAHIVQQTQMRRMRGQAIGTRACSEPWWDGDVVKCCDECASMIRRIIVV
jgi:hypothetical protein